MAKGVRAGVNEPLVLGVAVFMLVGAVAGPYFGWVGLQTEGPTVALAAAIGLLFGQRRRAAVVSVVAAIVAIAALVRRLATPPTDPIPAVELVLREALSRSSLWLALCGTALVLGVGLRRVLVPAGLGTPRVRGVSAAGLRPVVAPVVLSRLAVWAAGVLAVVVLGAHADVGGALERPFGVFGNTLVAPGTAWDAQAYLSIARSGYSGGAALAPFFPGYPILIRLFAFSPQATVIAGIAISIVLFALGSYLLWRLVALDYGDRVARLTVLLIAVFPTSLFFSAVYSESLYLAASLAAIYAARRDAWPYAGLCGAIATASRSNGVLVLIPLLLIYLYGPRPTPARHGPGPGPRHAIGGDVAWLLLVPAPLLLFLAYMGAHGDWLAPVHSLHAYWGRSFVPFAGIWRGAAAAWHAIQQIRGASHTPNLAHGALREVNTPTRISIANLTDMGFLLFAIGSLVVSIRKLPAAYSAYAIASIFLAVSEPFPGEPLASLPRYLLVIFPLMLSLAIRLTDHPRGARALLILSSGLMLLFASQFARGLWIA
ncbi:MAG TPA: mannosyltransferase family protein [Solirubrobacteraceae bacterium]|nr:mannosyltransferase family protein [Solirubrobacteraceae bacterium]